MFTCHTACTAALESALFVRQSVATFGFVPKLHHVMAEAPAAYEAYLRSVALFQEQAMPSEITEALREGTPLSDWEARSAAQLRARTDRDARARRRRGARSVPRCRLRPPTGARSADRPRGKVLSNDTNALAHTELDEPIKGFAWTHPADDTARAV